MDLVATRELAKIQAIVQFLKTQRDSLHELGDISALHSLEESFVENLEKAKKCGKVTSDPVSVVYNDWQRLEKWSNSIQTVLIEIDEIAKELDIDVSNRSSSWRPSIQYLQAVESPLNKALEWLLKTIRKGRDEVQNDDWSKYLPYPEMFQVASIMGWKSSLIISNLPGNNKFYTTNKAIETAVSFVNNTEESVRAFVSSRVTVLENSPLTELRNLTIRHRLQQLKNLKTLHKQHSNIISEIENYLNCGQLDNADKTLNQLSDVFSDLDYFRLSKIISSAKEQLQYFPHRISKTINSLDLFENNIKAFYLFPPLSLLKLHSNIIQDAEIYKSEIEKNDVYKHFSSQDEKLIESIKLLETRIASIKTEVPLRLRKIILICGAVWIGMLFTLLSLGFLWFKLHTNSKVRVDNVSKKSVLNQFQQEEHKLE